MTFVTNVIIYFKGGIMIINSLGSFNYIKTIQSHKLPQKANFEIANQKKDRFEKQNSNVTPFTGALPENKINRIMRKETEDAIKKITEGIENISQEILRVKAKKNDIYPTDFKKLNGVPLYSNGEHIKIYKNEGKTTSFYSKDNKTLNKVTEYDSKSEIKKVMIYNSDGTIDVKYFDPKRLELLEETRYNGKQTPIGSRYYVPHANYCVKQTVYNVELGPEKKHLSWIYNPKTGKCIKYMEYKPNGIIKRLCEYFKNTEKLVKETIYDANGNIKNIIEYDSKTGEKIKNTLFKTYNET